MDKEKEYYIKMGDSIVPLEVKNIDDLNNVTNACTNILSGVLIFGTSGIADTNKRVEKMGEITSQIIGNVLKRAVFNLSERAKRESDKEETDVGNA